MNDPLDIDQRRGEVSQRSADRPEPSVNVPGKERKGQDVEFKGENRLAQSLALNSEKGPSAGTLLGQVKNFLKPRNKGKITTPYTFGKVKIKFREWLEKAKTQRPQPLEMADRYLKMMKAPSIEEDTRKETAKKAMEWLEKAETQRPQPLEMADRYLKMMKAPSIEEDTRKVAAEKAMSWLEKAEGQEPNRIEIAKTYFKLAKAYGEAHEFDSRAAAKKAMEWLEKAEGQEPNPIEMTNELLKLLQIPWVGLRIVRVAAEKAMEWLEKAEAHEPNPIEIGNAYLRLAAPDEPIRLVAVNKALYWLEKAEKQEPNLVEVANAYLKLVEVCWEASEDTRKVAANKAMEWLEKAGEQCYKPLEIVDRYLLLKKDYRIDKFIGQATANKAMEWLKKAGEHCHEPREIVDRYLEVGKNYLIDESIRQAAAKKAMEWLEKAGDHEPNLVERAKEFIEVLQTSGIGSIIRQAAAKKAMEWLEKAEAHEPNPVEIAKTYIKVAGSYWEEGELTRQAAAEKAIYWLEKAEDQEPNPLNPIEIVKTYLELVKVYWEAGELTRQKAATNAMEWLKKAEDQEPNPVVIANTYLNIMKINGFLPPIQLLETIHKGDRWFSQSHISPYHVRKLYLDMAENSSLSQEVRYSAFLKAGKWFAKEGRFYREADKERYLKLALEFAAVKTQLRRSLDQAEKGPVNSLNIPWYVNSLILLGNWEKTWTDRSFCLGLMTQTETWLKNEENLRTHGGKLGLLYLEIARARHKDREIFRKIFNQANEWLVGLTVSNEPSSGEIGQAYLSLAEQSDIQDDIRLIALSAAEKWLSQGNYTNLPFYKMGSSYLKAVSQLRKNSLRQVGLELFESEARQKESPDKAHAAYQLGRLYSLVFPEKKLGVYWLKKAEKWQGLEESPVVREWLDEAEKDESSAHLLQKLSEIRKDNSLLAKLSPEILEKAETYGKELTQGQIPPPITIPRLCHCTIVGAGLSGILVALQLARLKDKAGHPLFKVTLLDQGPYIMSGASAVPARLHLGGEYPLDRTTALDCLYSAMLFWQMIPQGYTDIPAVAYVVHENTDKNAQNGDTKAVRLEDIVREYHSIKDKYSEYYSILRQDSRWDKNPLFGHPEKLFRLLTPGELPLNGFKGGILTHERGINPAILGAYLEEQLRLAGVEIQCGQAVTQVKHKEYGYKVYTEQGQSYRSQQVINATFDRYLDFERGIAQEKNFDQLNVFLRGMAAIDISNCEIPRSQDGEQAAIFGLMGEDGGMCSPFNDKLAWCFWPSEQGSYLSWGLDTAGKAIDSFPVAGENKENWDKLRAYEKELADNKKKRLERAKAILKELKTKYSFLKNAKVIDLIVRRILSPTTQTQRQHSMVRGWGEDGSFIQALSLKAVFAPLTALSVVRYSLEHLKGLHMEDNWDPEVRKAKAWLTDANWWLEEWRKHPLGVTLPELFQLPPLLDEQDLLQRAKSWAKDRTLPEQLVDLSNVSG